MFETKFNQLLKEKLKEYLPETYGSIDNANLLKAYAFFDSISKGKKIEETSFFFLPIDEEGQQEICSEFASLDLTTFIAKTMPMYIGSTAELDNITYALGLTADETIRLIIEMKEMFNSCKGKLSDIEIDKIYEVYCREYVGKKKLNQLDFKDMYIAINSVGLEYGVVGKEIGKNAIEAISILDNELLENKSRQLEYAVRCFSGKISDVELASLYSTNIFANKKVKEQKIDLFYKTMQKIMGCSPIDIFGAITLGRRSISGERISFAENPNDVMLETGILYNLVNSMSNPYGYNDKTIIFFPSPFFVKKWLRDKNNNNINVIFVTEAINEKRLFEMNYSPEYKMGTAYGKYSFMTYEEFCSSPDAFDDVGEYNFFVFGNDIATDKINKIYRLAIGENCVHNLMAISGDRKLEELLAKGMTSVSDIIALPAGLKDTKKPKQKCIWKCNVEERQDVVNICFEALSSDRRRLVLPGNEILETDVAAIVNCGEIRKKKDKAEAGKTRTKPGVFHITPDIQAYYTSEKYNEVKDRVNIYYTRTVVDTERGIVKEPVKESIISPTVKKGEIESILKEYPEYIKATRGKKRAEGCEEISIHEVIAEEARQELCNMDIAISTACYIYPELKKEMTADEYNLLVEMADGKLGSVYVNATSAEKYDDILSDIYFEESIRRRTKRVAALWKLLAFMRKRGHCTANVLDDALSGKTKDVKAFNWIRSALTKKSFTRTEFINAFCETIALLETDRDYLGVLMKLLLGLESNVICALEWDDYIEIEGYGIHALRIRKQYVEKEGKTVGFEDEAKYRIIPCPEILGKQIEIVKEKMSRKNEKKIIRCKPSELQKKSKSIIDSLGIKSVEVIIPTGDGDTIETDFSKYSGDFFRSNFRYWAKFAGMNLDETCFLLGNKRKTTYGIYYCDYNNEKMQIKMFIKLQRITAILLAEEKNNVVRRIKIEEDAPSVEIKALASTPTEINILVPKNNKGRLKIHNAFGFKSRIGEII